MLVSLDAVVDAAERVFVGVAGVGGCLLGVLFGEMGVVPFFHGGHGVVGSCEGFFGADSGDPGVDCATEGDEDLGHLVPLVQMRLNVGQRDQGRSWRRVDGQHRRDGDPVKCRGDCRVQVSGSWRWDGNAETRWVQSSRENFMGCSLKRQE